MADAATDNVTPRALRTRGVGASRAMPISQSVRPTATVQVMCTEGTLARESKPDEVEEEIAATSRRRRNRHEQTQLQQHRQPLTACLSLCQCVTLSVSSSSPQPMAARPRGGSVLPPRPRTTRGLCQGPGRRTIPVCPLLQLLHLCTLGPARRALVHSPSPTVMVPTAQR